MSKHNPVRDAAQRTLMAAVAGVLPKIDSAVPRVVALCYHSVHPNLPFASADPVLFRRHIEWLHEHCTIVPFDRLLIAASEHHHAARPVVALTFDDGYADNFDYALPILAETKTPATFFLTAGFVDGDPIVIERMRTQRRASDGAVRPMSWGQVRELQAAGFAFGSHTYSHVNLASLRTGDATREIERAKAVLEEHLQAPVPLFAYPWGRPTRHFTAETCGLVARAGHTDAAAVIFRGVRPAEDRLAIPRFLVGGVGIRTLEQRIRGAWDVVGLVQERFPRRVAASQGF
jgi:peptidoglycan/xylan/chitin deacetylase (PgdA/CDA1 family)